MIQRSLRFVYIHLKNHRHLEWSVKSDVVTFSTWIVAVKAVDIFMRVKLHSQYQVSSRIHFVRILYN